MKHQIFEIKAIAIQNDIEISDVPCNTINCTECCEKLSPPLTAKEVNSGKYIYTFVDHGYDIPVFAIPKTDTGCLYLSDKKQCKIYDYRPLSCRQFDCRKNHHPAIENKFI